MRTRQGRLEDEDGTNFKFLGHRPLSTVPLFLKNGLDFVSRDDASSISRNWIFCPEFTDTGSKLLK